MDQLPSHKFVYRLTRSQRMALLSVLAEYIQLPDQVQVFVDVTADTETTAPDLLNLFATQTELECSPSPTNKLPS